MKDISIRKIAQQEFFYLYNKSAYPFNISFSVNSTSKSNTLGLNDYVDITNATNVTINTEGYTKPVSKIYFPGDSIQKSGEIKEAWNPFSGSYKYIEVTEDFFNYPSKHGAIVHDTPSASSTPPTAIRHAAGTNLADASGNTYKINGNFSFNYTAAGGTTTKTVTTQSLSGANWNKAANIINRLTSEGATGGSASVTPPKVEETTAPAATVAPAAASAPAEAATTAPAAPAAPADTSKAIDGLKKILSLAASNSLKIDTKGFDFKSESKVWRGVIKGYGGADKAAEVCLRDAGFDEVDRVKLSEVAGLKDNDVSAKITMQPCLKKINDFFYKIKNTYSKRFLGITVATEDQIARAVAKGLSGGAGKTEAASLAQLNLLSKVAARRERAKKSLDSAIEKEASVEDDMTSKVEKRRAAARAKLGL